MTNSIHELKGKKVGLCVSGGLDSRTVARRLKDDGVDLICFTADLAQPDEMDINDIPKRMAACNVETVIVDLKDIIADFCFDVIKTQAKYDGGYWNTTGLARAVTVFGLIPAMKQKRCTVLAHGATGRGNDQIRFERYTKILAPEMAVYAPWRDPILLKEFPGRKQMAEFLSKAGIETDSQPSKRYSTDANLAGLSHEAEDLESLETPSTIVQPTMGVWPHLAPEEKEIFTVSFNEGYAVSLNGEPVTPLQAMQLANEIGGRNGIGIKNALENRIIGTKSRGVYESPGMELLGFCLEQVYQAILDRRSFLLFSHLSRTIANQIYDGRYFDPVTQAAKKGIDYFSRYASATVAVELYKGNIYFNSLTNCPTSLYNMDDSSMEASEGLNPVSSQGFIEVQNVEAISLARSGQISV